MPPKQEAGLTAAGTLTFKDYKKHNAYHTRKIVIGYAIFAFFAGMIVLPILDRSAADSWISKYLFM